MLKVALLAAFFAAFAFSAAVFDSAGAARAAMALNEAAQTATAGKAAMLARAEDALAARWSGPTRWHAGAIEALSWTKALEGKPAESGAMAERGLARGPVQPNAWLRLASLRAEGIGAGLCDARACLARSWRAAPVADAPLECARLELANMLGPRLTHADVRVQTYLATRPRREAIARCLAFMPPEERFAALARAR